MDPFAFDPPALTDDEIAAIADEHWGIRGDLHRLRGERSTNARIRGPRHDVVVQIHSAGEEPAVVDLKTEAMRHVAARAPDVPVGRVVPTVDGAALASVRIAGRVHLARAITYLPGTTFDPEQALPTAAYRAIGQLVGRVGAALADFDHPAARHEMPWDIANGLVLDQELRSTASEHSLRVIEPLDDRLRSAVGSMPALRSATVHNDGHAGNLLRPDATSSQVTGIIDFGDLVHTAVAADVAIIAESFAPDHPEPIEVTAAVAAGYHRSSPLDGADVSAIPELVLARAALDVLLTEHQIRHVPHLAADAQATLPARVARLVRWSELDASAMIVRIHAELER